LRLARNTLLLVATAALVQMGCGDSDTESGTASSGGNGGAATAEEIEVGSMLAQIRGHYRAAVERYEAGETADATKHARHPAREILIALRPDLEQMAPGSSQQLQSALDRVATTVAAERSAPQVEVAVDTANRATVTAEREAVGEKADSEAYRGSVIASLLATAAHEYKEAVAGNRVRLPIEYQDAYGFVREGEAMYGPIAPAVEEKSAAEAEEIEEAFGALQRAIPSGDPPQRPAPFEDVERNANLIGAELEETVGATPARESDPQAVRAKIEQLLDEALETYDPESPERAAELVAEAYLENYETIEGAVIEAAPDINAKLEPLLGAELRKRMREGAPVAEIESMVARAKQLLGQAVAALEEGG
jgi:hypothetical protein